MFCCEVCFQAGLPENGRVDNADGQRVNHDDNEKHDDHLPLEIAYSLPRGPPEISILSTSEARPQTNPHHLEPRFHPPCLATDHHLFKYSVNEVYSLKTQIRSPASNRANNQPSSL